MFSSESSNYKTTTLQLSHAPSCYVLMCPSVPGAVLECRLGWGGCPPALLEVLYPHQLPVNPQQTAAVRDPRHQRPSPSGLPWTDSPCSGSTTATQPPPPAASSWRPWPHTVKYVRKLCILYCVKLICQKVLIHHYLVLMRLNESNCISLNSYHLLFVQGHGSKRDQQY